MNRILRRREWRWPNHFELGLSLNFAKTVNGTRMFSIKFERESGTGIL